MCYQRNTQSARHYALHDDQSKLSLAQISAIPSSFGSAHLNASLCGQFRRMLVHACENALRLVRATIQLICLCHPGHVLSCSLTSVNTILFCLLKVGTYGSIEKKNLSREGVLPVYFNCKLRGRQSIDTLISKITYLFVGDQ